MISFGRNKFLLFVSIVLMSASIASSKPRKMQRLSTGQWGGVHININVEAGSASIDYDCATGTITGPLLIERNGRFTWRGTFHAERPGPIRRDDGANESPVVYTGTVIGDEMKLRVKRSGNNEVLGDFTLKRGGAGRVFKCK
jgi:hypothetical protein